MLPTRNPKPKTMPTPHPQPLTSRLLEKAGFKHAFFTRQGGVSIGPFASLNLSTEVGDEPDAVQTNWLRAAEALEVDKDRICVPAQVHGNALIELAQTDRADTIRLRRADAVVSGPLGMLCAIRTADCVPVLLADTRSGRVAAIHGGWKGLELDILGQVVAHFLRNGSSASDLVAAIGPHISRHAFEIGPEVAERLRRCANDPAVVQLHPETGRLTGDLSLLARLQLEASGLSSPLQIDELNRCTHGEPATFFSYRRDGAASGRMVSAISPRQAKS